MDQVNTFHVDESSLEVFATKIAQQLKSRQDNSPFVLWLEGDLGSGKTTTVRFILAALGLDKRVPVLSPTFTYLTEYTIGDSTYAHMDLYRLSEGDDLSVETLIEGRKFSGFFIEWPERIKGSHVLLPTHKLQISFSSENSRSWKLFKF